MPLENVQPDLVLRLLRADKHVLSEKFIAPTVAQGWQVLDVAQSTGCSEYANEHASKEHQHRLANRPINGCL